MTTKRNQLTTYVDEVTYQWVLSQAKREVRTVSQFLAALLVNSANGKTAPPPAQAYRAPAVPQAKPSRPATAPVAPPPTAKELSELAAYNECNIDPALTIEQFRPLRDGFAKKMGWED